MPCPTPTNKNHQRIKRFSKIYKKRKIAPFNIFAASIVDGLVLGIMRLCQWDEPARVCFQVLSWCTLVCAEGKAWGFLQSDPPPLHPACSPQKDGDPRPFSATYATTTLKWSENMREMGGSGGRRGGPATLNTGIWQHNPRVALLGTNGTVLSASFSQVAASTYHHCLLLSAGHSPSRELARARAGEAEGGLNKYLHLFKKGGQFEHNNSLQVYITQGVRHKFTCGKQAIHRWNPTGDPGGQTFNLCKGAASIWISSRDLWLMFALTCKKWDGTAHTGAFTESEPLTTWWVATGRGRATPDIPLLVVLEDLEGLFWNKLNKKNLFFFALI